MNKYTSLELSKFLHENWCKLKSDMVYFVDDMWDEYFWELDEELKADALTDHVIIKYRAYDILNDICVKYAKEFFELQDRSEYDWFLKLTWGYKVHTREIFQLLQQWKKQEAEAYILEHTIFNSNNK